MATRTSQRPKPTALKEFEGNPGGKPLNKDEPKPGELKSLEPPDWLVGDAGWMDPAEFDMGKVSRQIWEELLPQLTALGVVTSVDRDKFARYCETLARWFRTKAILDKHGETFASFHYHYDDKNKKLVKNAKDLKISPHFKIYDRLTSQLDRYELEFGIGASCRSKIVSAVGGMGSGLKANAAGEQQPDAGDFDYASRRKRVRLVS